MLQNASRQLNRIICGKFLVSEKKIKNNFSLVSEKKEVIKIEDKITFFSILSSKKSMRTHKQTNKQTITAGGRCLQRCIKFTCSLQHVASQHIETRPELLYHCFLESEKKI